VTARHSPGICGIRACRPPAWVVGRPDGLGRLWHRRRDTEIFSKGDGIKQVAHDGLSSCFVSSSLPQNGGRVSRNVRKRDQPHVASPVINYLARPPRAALARSLPQARGDLDVVPPPAPVSHSKFGVPSKAFWHKGHGFSASLSCAPARGPGSIEPETVPRLTRCRERNPRCSRRRQRWP
jgi:hypothetical protein